MSHTDDYSIENLRERFIQKFGRADQPIHEFFAPGRVNLIGEYTDFTGGLVFPCGVDRGTTLLIRPGSNGQYRFASTNFDLIAQLDQHEISQTYGDNWINYPLGILDQFSRRGVPFNGFDCLFSGNIPNGAGLSSSASIEVVTAFALNELLDTGFTLLDLVSMAQAAENDFVGMQCGIMDQFAVAFAKSDHAIMLDCHSLEHQQVPLQLDDLSIIVSNTNQRRELNESAYNDRVRECQRALELLAPATGIDYLGQLQSGQLDAHEPLFVNDPIPLRRARHIVDENNRVRNAVPALQAGDLQQFGQIMNQSHESLRTLFEVSSEPLNHLVKLAREQEGVLGSRLTGAGFGGCTVSILPTSRIDAFCANVGPAYTRATGLTADFYPIAPGSGVGRLTEEQTS